MPNKNLLTMFPAWLLLSLAMAFGYWTYLFIVNPDQSNKNSTQTVTHQVTPAEKAAQEAQTRRNAEDARKKQETAEKERMREKMGRSGNVKGHTEKNLTPRAPAAPVLENKQTPASIKSPPGKDPRASDGLIAFVARQDRKREIFTMRPDGSCLRSLTAQFTDAFAPVWSPDGMTILFRAGDAGDFYVTDGDGSNLRKVMDIGDVALDFPGMQSSRLNANATWLPDGKTIAVCAGQPYSASNVYMVEVASQKRTILSLAKAAWDPVWSPDGTRIAFVTSNTAGQRNQQFQVWLANGKGAQQVPICGECEVQAGPLWLSDGKRLIFIKGGGWANGKRNNKLCMKNVDNGEFTEADFAWDIDAIVASPDGQKIAFSPEHSSPIYIYQLTGKVWQRAATIENGEYPSWSPDGTSLSFVSSVDHQIWLANMDGTGRVKINPVPEPVAPAGSESRGVATTLVSQKERPAWSPTHIPPFDSSNPNKGDTTLPARLSGENRKSLDVPRPEPPRPEAVTPQMEKSRPDASGERAKPLADVRAEAERGDAKAQDEVGKAFYLGNLGVKKDYKEAITWFRKAADQGLAEAQYYMGVCNNRGEGVAANAVEAAKWFRKAAEQNFARAQTMLGRSYASGRGVARDDAQSVMWCRKAAEQNDELAQMDLASHYESGKGVEKDLLEAYKWKVLGARQNMNFKKAVTALERLMTPEQIAEGNRRADDWRKQHFAPVGSDVAVEALSSEDATPSTSPSNATSGTLEPPLASPADETRELRTWTYRSGLFTMKASFVSEQKGIVVLKKEDGSSVAYSESNLSDEDQRYIQGIKKKVSTIPNANEGK